MSDTRNDELLSTKEAAAIAGANVRRVRDWCYNDYIPYTMVKNQIRLKRQDLDAFLGARQQARHTSQQPELPLALSPAARPAAPHRRDETASLRREVSQLKQERDRLQRALSAAQDREAQTLMLLEQALSAAQDRELRLFRLLEHVYEPTPPRTLATRTLSDRVLEHMREVGTARTPKQVQQFLGSSRSVERVLRYLVDRGDLYRPRPGWFQVLPTREETRQEQVLQYLRREGRSRLVVQVQEALALEEPPYNELGRLERMGLVKKERPGRYRAVAMEKQEHTVSAEAAEDLG